MKAFDGFKSEASGKRLGQLPAGPYVAQIKAVKIEGLEPDQTLILRLDIAEGEHAGYYTKRFKRDMENDKSPYPVKYKGDLKFRIPNKANTKALYPESDLSRFNNMIFRIESSNPGYHWDWNEQGLVGLMVGVSVQQGSYNGYEFTRIARLETADDVRQGLVHTMAPAAPKSDAYEPQIDQQSGYVQVNTDDVPF